MNILNKLVAQLDKARGNAIDYLADTPERKAYLDGLRDAMQIVEKEADAFGTEDIVRIVRIYEFSGPRSIVEEQVERSVQQVHQYGNGVLIRAATLGTFPQIMFPVKKGEEE